MNAVKIGSAYIPVKTIEEAVTLWEDWRDTYNLGASESPRVTLCFEKKLYRISYNGRVWDAGTGAEVSVGPRITKSPKGAIKSCAD